MPTCLVCDGEDFELTNGLYFCKICSTQSQEIVEQGYDNVAELQVGRIIKAKQKKLKDKELDRGKPWYTVEAYQVILKAQVEALIKLGINPKLKDVVKEIWFKYLQISGNVVINPSNLTSKFNNLMTFRDEYLSGILGSECIRTSLFPTIKNPMRLKVPKRRKYTPEILSTSSSEEEEEEKYQKKTIRKQERLHKNTKMKEKPWRSDEEWFTLASDSSSESDEVQPALSSIEKPKYTRIDRRKGGRERNELKQRRIAMDHLTINKLLAILQVALRWCHEYVDTGDILLWIQQGYIPYIDCLQSLPPHMKLTNFDNNIQNKPIPTYQQMSYLHDAMTKYIDMPKMPEPNLLHLVAKYILQLNLPRTLTCFIKTLMNVSEFENDPKDSIIPEVAAMSLIIISAKLLFGLDEKREWITDFNVENCRSHKLDCDPFKWSEWVGYHLQRREDNQSCPINTFHMKDVEKVGDISAYVEHWNNLLINSTLACKEKGGVKTSTKYKKEMLQSRTWVFIKMAESQLDELEHCKAARDYPYVTPVPPLHLNMTNKCILFFIHNLRNNPEYIWYTDEFSRLARFRKPTNSSGRFELVNNSYVEGQLQFHKTYSFLLTLTSEITCACVPLIHTAVREIETRIISPFLEAKDEQKYLFTDFDGLHC